MKSQRKLRLRQPEEIHCCAHHDCGHQVGDPGSTIFDYGTECPCRDD